MSTLDPIQVIKDVHQWNEEHLIYQHGSLQQQITKYYRMLGTVAEGIQKWDSLTVAVGVGNAVTTLVGVLGFYANLTKVPVEEIALPVLDKAIGGQRNSKNYGHDYHTLLFQHNKEMTALFEALLDNEHERQQQDIIYYSKMAETLALLLAIATGKGLIVTRTVLNAVNKLVTTQGVMNEFGQFVKTATGTK